jgi:hypothetical protein
MEIWILPDGQTSLLWDYKGEQMTMGRRPGCRLIFLDGFKLELVDSYDTVSKKFMDAVTNSNGGKFVLVGEFTDFNTNKPVAVKLDTVSRVEKAGW